MKNIQYTVRLLVMMLLRDACDISFSFLKPEDKRKMKQQMHIFTSGGKYGKHIRDALDLQAEYPWPNFLHDDAVSASSTPNLAHADVCKGFVYGGKSV